MRDKHAIPCLEVCTTTFSRLGHIVIMCGINDFFAHYVWHCVYAYMKFNTLPPIDV